MHWDRGAVSEDLGYADIVGLVLGFEAVAQKQP
jgi:hypothetical protein